MRFTLVGGQIYSALHSIIMKCLSVTLILSVFLAQSGSKSGSKYPGESESGGEGEPEAEPSTPLGGANDHGHSDEKDGNDKVKIIAYNFKALLGYVMLYRIGITSGRRTFAFRAAWSPSTTISTSIRT